MGEAAGRRFEEPDEVREFAHGRTEIVHLAGSTAGKAVLEPGWTWEGSVKPIVGGESCQAHHLGYVLAGALHLVTDEGEEYDVGPGDVYEILPGHHAQVTGDVAFEALEFQSKTAETYAKK
jgi:hypothetical protein